MAVIVTVIVESAKQIDVYRESAELIDVYRAWRVRDVLLERHRHPCGTAVFDHAHQGWVVKQGSQTAWFRRRELAWRSLCAGGADPARPE